MLNKYIPLHVHSMGSLSDAISSPKEICKRIINLELDGCGLSDHGNILNAISFYNEFIEQNLKPVLGIEAYICNQHSHIQNSDNRKLTHFLFFAQGDKGFQELLKFVDLSNRPETYYYKPRLSLKEIAKQNFQHLIGISGHLGSTLSAVILDENNKVKPNWKKNGIKLVEYCKEILHNNFYVEIQLIDSQNTPETKVLAECLREIAKLTKTKTVATPDSHYCTQAQQVDQLVLLANNFQSTIKEVKNKGGFSAFFKSSQFHIPSYKEMLLCGNTEEELENTLDIHSQCGQYTNILKQPLLPDFRCPNNITTSQHLRHLCEQGWNTKIENKIPQSEQQKYRDRLNYELEVIEKFNLCGYFLMVQDIVTYARKQNFLVGGARGSAAGSLVSNLINITNVDPIKWKLYFERFLNPGRFNENKSSLPDIDIDLQTNGRDRVIRYIRNTYGQDRVAQMVTIAKLHGRSAIKAVLRAHNVVSFDEMNLLTKKFPQEHKIMGELEEMRKEEGEASSIKYTLLNDEKGHLSEWCRIENNELTGPLSKYFAQAIRLEGTQTHQSKHAAGIGIASVPLNVIAPLVYDPKSKTQILGFEMADLEKVGVVKLDILGLQLLDKIQSIQQILRTGDISD